MIRILQAVNIMDRAGLETMLMNYYRNADRSEIQFDFLVHRDEIGAYEGEILEMGGHIYHAPRLYPQNYIKYFRYMKELFKNNPDYKIVHSHMDSMSFFTLLAAKKNGIPIRIGHSHSSKLDKDIKLPIKFLALKMMPKVANVYFACGEMAGNFMFPNKKFTIIHNAIDINKFTYDEHVRNKVRNKFDIQEQFVVGHVGRYCYIKNQMFLLDVFKEILGKRPDSVLFLVGKGEDENKLRNKVRDLKIEDRVKFLIDRADVNELYQAFDVFVMPSLFEGLPLVGVEAQANGLPCVFSDRISREVILTSNAIRFPLLNSASLWSDRILELGKERNVMAKEELQNKGYDIKIEAEKLQNWYCKKYQEIVGDKIK